MPVNLTDKERVELLFKGMVGAYQRILSEKEPHSGWVEDPNTIIVRLDAALDSVINFVEGGPEPWF